MNLRSTGFGFLSGIILATGFAIMLAQERQGGPPSGEDNTDEGTKISEVGMRIQLAGIFVDDQEKAVEFYTKTLGFVVKDDIPLGEYRWLTVVSPEAPEGMELLLEPNAHSAAAAYQKAIYKDRIPATTLFVDEIETEVARLKKAGVTFTTEPTRAGEVILAVFDDECGNLIQLVQR